MLATTQALTAHHADQIGFCLFEIVVDDDVVVFRNLVDFGAGLGQHAVDGALGIRAQWAVVGHALRGERVERRLLALARAVKETLSDIEQAVATCNFSNNKATKQHSK